MKKMKLNKLVLSFICLLSLSTVAQIPQIPCNKLPTVDEIKNKLMYKPVINITPNQFRIGCNINDSIKKRMLYLLNWEWSKKEIEDYLLIYIDNHKILFDIDNKAQKISNGNDSLFKVAKDSIIKTLKNIELDYLDKKNYYDVSDGLILAVANLGLTKAVPMLEKALKYPNHYHTSIVELALAKLGNKALQKKIISECNYNPSLNGQAWNDYFTPIGQKLAFIKTQESIQKIGDWLDSTKVFASTTRGNNLDKSASNVIWFLSYLILNKDFQQIISSFHYGDFNEAVNNDMILRVKEWLIKNKGKYKVNQGFCPL
jgi:hypothetical protein